MAKDRYHDLVKTALLDEGWLITDDPYEISSLVADLEVDLAAERIIAAENETEKIAVEVKSFLGRSWLHDFYKAVGQFGFYNLTIELEEPERKLFLAIPEAAFNHLFRDPVAQELARINRMKFLVFSVEDQKIVSWKK